MKPVNNYIKTTDLNSMKETNLVKEVINSKDYILNNKIETLLSHKFSIEKLLKLIKQFQLVFISKNSIVNDSKIKKRILLELKENLSDALTKKNIKFNFNKKEIDEKKEKINKKILLNTDIEKNRINYMTEIKQLKFINFNIENEIKTVNCMIKAKSVLKDNYSEYLGILNEQKIYYDHHKQSKATTIEIMKEEKKAIQQQLIDLTMKKYEQEEEINDIRLKISKLKNKIKETKKTKLDKSKECSDGNTNIKVNQCEKNQFVRNKYKELIQKWEDFFVNKNNSCSESSNKETNFCSVKNFVDNIDKLNEENNINYNYLKNHIFFDIDNNNKISNSFNSSLDSDF